MIAPLESVAPLNGQEILWLFNDTDNISRPVSGTD
jgi:hypothetical protein